MKKLLFLLLAIMLVLTGCQSDINGPKNGLVVPSWLVGLWDQVGSQRSFYVEFKSDDFLEEGTSVRNRLTYLKTLKSNDNAFVFEGKDNGTITRYTFEKITNDKFKLINDNTEKSFERSTIC